MSDFAPPREGISSSAASTPPGLNKKPAMAPPIRDATMKSHTWASAAGFAPAPISAGPSERAGLSDVDDYVYPDEAAFADEVHARAIASFFCDTLLRPRSATCG